MPNIEESERYFQKVINRWENEGGAIMQSERPRRDIVDDQDTAQSGQPLARRMHGRGTASSTAMDQVPARRADVARW